MGALDLVMGIGKGALGAVKKTAPFFSKADVVLDELQRGKGTGNEFLTELVKKGAKPTELKERGIEQKLKAMPKVNKAEVKKVFQENPPPKIKEEVRGGNEIQEALDEKAREIIGDPYATYDDLYGRDAEAAKYAVERDFGYNPETQYEEWKTPGGENYREILLKLPKRGLNEAQQRDLMIYESDMRRGKQLDPYHQKRYDELKAQEASGNQDYMSSHWKGTPNVLAHIRVQDFKTPEGKKVLLVDEIQSDWHQAGRKKGYKSDVKPEENAALVKQWDALANERRDLERVVASGDDADPFVQNAVQRLVEVSNQLNLVNDRLTKVRTAFREGVPDAPFKKNWHELAMKRVLDYAAENGYDTVAITPGAEQAKRYDLSKQVDELLYKKNPDGTYQLSAQAGGRGNMMGEAIPAEKLEDYVGKEVAQKIVGGEGKATEVMGKYDPASMTSSKDYMQSLSGVDLQVGGEGMKGFYDKILPDYLNTFGKQYGSGVGEIDLITKPEKSVPQIAAPGLGHFPEPIIEPAQTMKAWSFDITPQLREQIKTKGLPLYSKTGMGPEGLAAGTGAATIGAEALTGEDEQQVQNPVHFTENPDAMQLELMQRN